MRPALVCVGFLAAVVLAGMPLWAQERGDSSVLPVVAHTEGQGSPPTRWVSDVTIHNVTDQAITVGMAFFPFEHENSWGGNFPVTLAVGARETVLVEDVIGSRFGMTGDAKGALLVTCSNEYFPENSPDAAMIVSSRTYNVGNPSGTFGQTVWGNEFLWNGSSTPSTIVGARNDDRFRSNLGIVNLSFNPITVHYRFLAADHSPLKEGKWEIPSASGKQRLFSSLGIGKVQGPITVDLWLDPADVTPDPCTTDANFFVAYVSKVDGNPDGTGDAEFLYAVPTQMPPAGWDCP